MFISLKNFPKIFPKMSKLLIFSLSFLLLFLPSLSQNPNSNPSNSSAYNELKSKGFPIGLLPINVISYSLNRNSGDFFVDLSGDCRITLPPDNYIAAYSKRIGGKILDGKIFDLDGIRVRVFFRWWSISGIRVSGDDLVFEVGVVSAKYPKKNFEEIQGCEGWKWEKKADS